MIEEKPRLVQLLDDYLSGAGLTVVIGSEHSKPDLHSFSIVAATYDDGRGTGAVGVIGPTRMRYSRAINAVDSLTRAMNRMVGRPNAIASFSTNPENCTTVEDNRNNIAQDPLDETAAASLDETDQAGIDSATGRDDCATFCSASPPSSTTIASAPSATARHCPTRHRRCR